MAARPNGRERGGITFHHPGAFWFGAGAVTGGVLLMLPMYISARDLSCPGAAKYCLAGKDVNTAMLVGMVLTIVGIVSTAYGLFPRLSEVSHGYVSRIRVRALDDAKIRGTHVALLLVLAAA